eukprot:gene7213-biopygen22511
MSEAPGRGSDQNAPAPRPHSLISQTPGAPPQRPPGRRCDRGRRGGTRAASGRAQRAEYRAVPQRACGRVRHPVTRRHGGDGGWRRRGWARLAPIRTVAAQKVATPTATAESSTSREICRSLAIGAEAVHGHAAVRQLHQRGRSIARAALGGAALRDNGVDAAPPRARRRVGHAVAQRWRRGEGGRGGGKGALPALPHQNRTEQQNSTTSTLVLDVVRPMTNTR